jgi:hypothetical protein
LSGARADLIAAFQDIGALKRLVTRMKWFYENNWVLKRSAVDQVLANSEIQQRANFFLEAIEEKYGEDKQYQNIMEETSRKHDQFYAQNKAAVESPKTKFWSWGVKILYWAKNTELKLLNSVFAETKVLVYTILFKYY